LDKGDEKYIQKKMFTRKNKIAKKLDYCLKPLHYKN